MQVCRTAVLTVTIPSYKLSDAFVCSLFSRSGSLKYHAAARQSPDRTGDVLLASVEKELAKGSSCQSLQEVDSVKCFHALPLRLSRDALRQRPRNA